MIAITCPLCRQPLARDARTWRCTAGHAFDVAREGYVNLLPVQQRHSRQPGDNPAMVRARHDFLAAGHYAPLRAALLDLVRPLAPRRLVDIGCGEGWYTGALATLAEETVGIDIAKDAVRLAARQYPAATWLVAGSARLPLGDGSVDLATALFSPVSATEAARVLAADGHLLLAMPAADHLQALRAALFDEVRPHDPDKALVALGDAFELQTTADVRFALQLDQAALCNLLAMTPYAWRATPQKRAALEACTELATEAAFRLVLLRRQAQPSVAATD
jgi:23S rRNA (guanine745-N1)-methyltransferase